jgi:hypothetical protein
MKMRPAGRLLLVGAAGIETLQYCCQRYDPYQPDPGVIRHPSIPALSDRPMIGLPPPLDPLATRVTY